MRFIIISLLFIGCTTENPEYIGLRPDLGIDLEIYKDIELTEDDVHVPTLIFINPSSGVCNITTMITVTGSYFPENVGPIIILDGKQQGIIPQKVTDMKYKFYMPPRASRCSEGTFYVKISFKFGSVETNQLSFIYYNQGI